MGPNFPNVQAARPPGDPLGAVDGHAAGGGRPRDDAGRLAALGSPRRELNHRKKAAGAADLASQIQDLARWFLKVFCLVKKHQFFFGFQACVPLMDY